MLVPSIGIEPATPMQANMQASVTPIEGSIPRTQLLAPSGSLSGSGQHTLRRGSGSKSVASGDGYSEEEQGSAEEDKRKPPSKRGLWTL